MQNQTVPCAADDADSEINLTPMLDVVFIMLIFFVVTASFIREAGISVNRPPGSDVVIAESDSIFIEIEANSEIRMGPRIIDPRAVRANIERMHAENPQARVVIKAHPESFNDTLVQVMNASREAGLYDIVIADE